MKELVEGELSYRVTGICFSIHNELGRFLTEKQYCDALAVRLKEQKISFTREPDLDTKFHDEVLKIGRPDFVIEKTSIPLPEPESLWVDALMHSLASSIASGRDRSFLYCLSNKPKI